jgi:FtsP/CotA-like multicopper oxidase with cupredoxin domain
MFTRRRFLAAGGAAGALGALPAVARAAAADQPVRVTLEAAPATQAIVGPGYPATAVWGFNGGVPGPEIRVRRDAPLAVAVRNALSAPTSVHWHGLRIANAMDGVPGLTQPAIAPGATFDYAYRPPDAGTYWYHSHQRGYEQVARGLYGALIVEEPEPYPADREAVWVLDDWRLTRQAAIAEDFGHRMQASHAGRIGNTVTLGGRLPEELRLAPGERVRLRIVNVATARIFALGFGALPVHVIALDGQPVTPHAPAGGRVRLGPAQRADLVLDAPREPGRSVTVVDDANPRQAYRVTAVTVADRPARGPHGPVAGLPDNALPEPDLERADRRRVVMTGGAMGRMSGARVDGRWLEPRQLMRAGAFWALNDRAQVGETAAIAEAAPLLRLKRGGHYRIAFVNETRWPHPMHLHGHHFRVLSRRGQAVAHRPWRDTVLLDPGDTVETALVADNPGRWLLHCHILAHQATGMAGVVEVA